eukprot:GSChrysophyteH2.ASY1.ANO1.901.1 assembled CDS
MVNYQLVLDPAIRNWVVLPMILLMTFVGLGRSYAQQLMQAAPKIGEKEFDQIRHKQTCSMAERVRIMGNLINRRSYNQRKTLLVGNQHSDWKRGLLQEKVAATANPMMSGDPSAMVGMLKNQAVFMVPNFAMMQFVNLFFQGFVCLRVPFSLPSIHFKDMLQRGVDISTLDVTYVSSISWYILLTFGLNGVYRLILDEGTEMDEGKMMQMQMQMGVGGGGGMGGGFDANNAFKQARSMLSISKNQFLEVTDRAEKKLLGDRYPINVDSDDSVDLSKFQ